MSEIEAQARACRDAAQIVAGLDSAARRTLLLAMAQALEVNAGLILAGNARDLAAAREKGIGSAMLDRLALDPARLFAMAEAVREIAALPDPVGQITRDDVRPNGIHVKKMRETLCVVARCAAEIGRQPRGEQHADRHRLAMQQGAVAGR